MQMRLIGLASGLLALWFAGGEAAAAHSGEKRPAKTRTVRAKAPEPEAAEKPIRQAAEDFKRAFNRGDAKAVAALWTPEGEYIDEGGNVFAGRAEIEKEYAGFFKEHPGSQLQIHIDSIRFVGPALAFEEGTSRLIEPPVGATSVSHYTVVHLKQDGKWLMASVRDVESGSLSNHESLQDLEPLIGNWTATSGETRVEMTCEWVENRNFIKRSYKAYRGEDLVGSGFEIIGIDHEIGEISSWQFTSDGGLGHNVWHRDGQGWVIEARGTTPQGEATAATNILTPEGKDAFSYRSVDRMVDGEPSEETVTAKIVRKK
jgi:uncharacterized protein (TIGR02246 family)